MKNNDWKQQLSIVYSTNPDFGKEDTEEEQETALPPSEQRLKILLDKKNRNMRQKVKEILEAEGYNARII